MSTIRMTSYTVAGYCRDGRECCIQQTCREEDRLLIRDALQECANEVFHRVYPEAFVEVEWWGPAYDLETEDAT